MIGIKPIFLSALATVALTALPGYAENAPATEADFVVLIEAMEAEAFTPAIISTFAQSDCEIDIHDGMDAFFADLSRHVALMVGYEGIISPETGAVIVKLTDPAADALGREGRLVVDRDAGVATLAGCN